MPDLRSLLQPVFDHPAFGATRAAAESPPVETRGEPTLSGLTRSGKALVVAGLAHEVQRPLIVFTANNETADRLCRTASTFLEWLEPGTGPSVGVLPAADSTPYEGRSPHPEISERRAVALWNLARGRTRILFVPFLAALGRFREKSYYGSLALELKVGDELDLSDLTEHLGSVGYEPGEPVETPGNSPCAAASWTSSLPKRAGLFGWSSLATGSSRSANSTRTHNARAAARRGRCCCLSRRRGARPDCSKSSSKSSPRARR